MKSIWYEKRMHRSHTRGMFPASMKGMTAFCLLMLWGLGTGSAAEKMTVTWLDMDVPPFYILKGEYADTGIADEITKLFQHHLPQYAHKRMSVTFARAMEQFKSGESVCHAAFFKTPEREEFAYFSAVPSDIVPPVGITVKKKNLEKFETGSPLSLAALLQNSSLRCGAVKGRSYGAEIDQLLLRYQNKKHVFLRTSGQMYEGMFSMLLADRFDYLIGSPLEAMYASKSVSEKGEEIVNLPLQENSSYLLGYVACTKNEWGKQMIEKVNTVLRQERPTEQYKSFFERWLDERSFVQFRKDYESIFLQTGN